MTSSGAIGVSGGGAFKGKGAAVAEVKNKVDGSGKPVSIVMKKPVNVVIKPEFPGLEKVFNMRGFDFVD
ncbi:hypothetical protein B296_00008663 [Ensete ventricosum]|uniref:Uncharacterized protein n=1 Tax=Ensete ventricosum TaxID=4639 RepID=A0A426ZXI6_ENSVE|nr:hypothetical protein B296_00008663 [Ensete ventricosum]